MNPDLPIDKPSQDSFHYHPLATQLAPHVVGKSGTPSYVVGVEAPWGSGKTSFLNLVRNAVQELNSGVVILDYRPWVYSTADSLILGFCIQLTSQFNKNSGRNYRAVGDALLGFAHALKPLQVIPIAGAVVNTLETGSAFANKLDEINKLDISSAREKVQQALDKFRKPVIVFIDDVDRLQQNEIRLLFQFLKAVADFRGVTYILAYDPIPVEKALSSSGALDGREFLKKFIQLPVKLPRLSRLLMRGFLNSAVEKLNAAGGVHLQGSEQEALCECVTSNTVLGCLKTPRDVIRCFNLLRLRLDECYGEVEIPSLFRFVLLDLICPEAIERVQRQPHLFLAGLSSHPEFERGTDSIVDSAFFDSSSAQAARERLIDTLPEAQRVNAKLLLAELFPSDREAGDSGVRSANDASGLIKLLYGGSSPMAFSAREAVAFLEGENRQPILDEKVADGVLKEWIYFLSSLTESSTVSDPVGLADSFFNVLDRVQSDRENLFRLVGEFLTQVLEKLGDPDEVKLFADEIIRRRTHILVSHFVLLRLSRNAGLWANGVSYSVEEAQIRHSSTLPLSAETVLNLQRKWVTIVKELSEEGYLHNEVGLSSILHRWGQFLGNEYRGPHEYFVRISETSDILIVLKALPVWGEGVGAKKLIGDYNAVLASLNRYHADPDARKQAIECVRNWMESGEGIVADG